MSGRYYFAMIAVICTLSQIGCCALGTGGCGLGGQCFYGGCASCGLADACCGCPSCGVADSCCGDCASCGCPDASCGCPDASCGCPDGCGSAVTGQQCPLLARLRNALNRCYLKNHCACSGCCGPAYRSEWSDSPPCNCDPCDCYGNYTGGYGNGGNYASQHGRRARLAKKNIADELGLESAEGPIYR